MDFWGHFLVSHADAKAKLETLKAHHQLSSIERLFYNWLLNILIGF